MIKKSVKFYRKEKKILESNPKEKPHYLVASAYDIIIYSHIHKTEIMWGFVYIPKVKVKDHFVLAVVSNGTSMKYALLSEQVLVINLCSTNNDIWEKKEDIINQPYSLMLGVIL